MTQTTEHEYRRPVLQDWVMALPFMQQTVLLTAIRGCDGMAKQHQAKALVKWYRRCVLFAAFEGRVLTTPYEDGGGSFTGPSCASPEEISDCARMPWPVIMEPVVNRFLESRDEMHMHYQMHMMHAFEIVGYKHPDYVTRQFWSGVYMRMAWCYHLWPETMVQMDERLGDDRKAWEARTDASEKLGMG